MARLREEKPHERDYRCRGMGSAWPVFARREMKQDRRKKGRLPMLSCYPVRVIKHRDGELYLSADDSPSKPPDAGASACVCVWAMDTDARLTGGAGISRNARCEAGREQGRSSAETTNTAAAAAVKLYEPAWPVSAVSFASNLGPGQSGFRRCRRRRRRDARLVSMQLGSSRTGAKLRGRELRWKDMEFIRTNSRW